MRSILGLTLLVLLAGCISTSTTYSDEEISFECPQGWTLKKEAETTENEHYIRQITCTNEDWANSAVIGIMWIKPETSLDYTIDVIRQKPEVYDVSSISNIEFKQHQAIYVSENEFETDSGRLAVGETIIFQCNGKTIWISIAELKEQKGSNSDIFNQIKESFKCM